MADAAIARREARRKRILQNSSNRLQLIANITNDECCKDNPVKSVRNSIPKHNNETTARTVENVPKEIINNGIISEEPLPCEPLPDINLDHVLFGEQNTTHDLAAFASKPEASEASVFEKLINQKYDLVVLSLLMQFLHFSVMPFDNTYFFLPLILYLATKAVFIPQQKSMYANIFMLLNSRQSPYMHKLISVLHWVSSVTPDVFIYLFITVCVQAILIEVSTLIS